MPLERSFQIALVPLSLDRHSENVGGTLKKREIVLDELIA